MKRVLVAIALMASSSFVIADEVKCLAQNIYWEARNQSIQGMYAVADVTLNRVKDKRWPSTVCEVVKQRKNAGKTDFMAPLVKRFGKKVQPGMGDITFVPSSRGIDYKQAISSRGNGKARLRPMR